MKKRLVELQETAVGDIAETGVKLSNLENHLKTIEMTTETREKEKEIMKGIDTRMERKDLEEAREIEDSKVIQARTKEWQDRIKIMENNENWEVRKYVHIGNDKTKIKRNIQSKVVKIAKCRK